VLGNLAELEIECADREKMEAQVSELEQNSALVARLFEKLAVNVATIFSHFEPGKKSQTDLVKLEII
jgi:hypothetical protein